MLGTELASFEDQQVLLITELYQQIFFFSILKLHVSVPIYVCLYTCVRAGGDRVQKRVSHSMELDLQTVASCHMDAGNQTLLLYQSSSEPILPLSRFPHLDLIC